MLQNAVLNSTKHAKVTKQRSITFTTGLAQITLPNFTIYSDRSRPYICLRWSLAINSVIKMMKEINQNARDSIKMAVNDSRVIETGVVILL